MKLDPYVTPCTKINSKWLLGIKNNKITGKALDLHTTIV